MTGHDEFLGFGVQGSGTFLEHYFDQVNPNIQRRHSGESWNSEGLSAINPRKSLPRRIRTVPLDSGFRRNDA
jgi:hypothetical protein